MATDLVSNWSDGLFLWLNKNAIMLAVIMVVNETFLQVPCLCKV